MEYEWDPAKDAENRRKHGIAFDAITDFEWDEAIIVLDDRQYGERRWLALAPLKGRLYSVAFTLRLNKIRLISFRPASRKERRLFDEPRG